MGTEKSILLISVLWRLIGPGDMKCKIKNVKLKMFFLWLCVVALAPIRADAARLYIEVREKTLARGQLAHADVWLDPEGALVNAVEGGVLFEKEKFALKDISSADSIVNFWVEQPREVSQGEVFFSGIIPGGFSGVLSPYYEGARAGKVLSLALRAKESGSAMITLQNPKALLNDGNGTAVSVQESSVQLVISPQGAGGEFVAPVLEDRDIPESFSPMVAQDASLFNGKWFMAFSTKDKGSGIDRYEVREDFPQGDIRRFFSGKNQWKRVESPYALYDQARRSNVLIKAIDRHGNERIATVLPIATLPWYKDYRISGILLIVVLALWMKRLRARASHR